MNASDLKAFIRQISKEKELDVAVVKEAIEQAIISASKKNLSQFKDARPDLDPETGGLRLFVKKTVVNIATNPRTQVSAREAHKVKKDSQIGDEIEIEIDPALFGRIAAQSARQVVMQKLRDAERRKVFDEFIGKTGEIVTGIVQRFEKRDVILAVGKAEALLPRNEIPVTSHYRVGDRIKVYVLSIDPEAKGPIIRVSRTHPQLVAKLFEQEVPEIADGTVKIVKVAREPGSRTKIAVESTNPDVDPVGACVGVKGSRVQMIVRELENEKIDIVPFSAKLQQFITNALVPAQISSINILEDQRKAIVVVKQGNLSLAIGKRGQNAKLAARLADLTLDIHSEGEEKKLANVNVEEVQRKYLQDFLEQMERSEAGTGDKLLASKHNTVQLIAEAPAHEVATILGVDVDSAEEIVEGAREYLEALAEMTRSNYGDEAGEGEGESESEEQEPAPVGEDEPGEAPEAPAEDTTEEEKTES